MQPKKLRRLGPLARWDIKRGRDGQLVAGPDGNVIPVVRLTDEGQRYVTAFLEQYNPPVKLVRVRFPQQYTSLLKAGLTDDDINSVCKLAAYRCAEKFDPAFGWKFVTYFGRCLASECRDELGRHRRATLRGAVATVPMGGDDYHATDDTEGTTEERDSTRHARERMAFAFAHCRLSENERKVIIGRYGLHGGKPCKLAELRAIVGMVTRERVRQIHNEALVKIQKALEGKELVQS